MHNDWIQPEWPAEWALANQVGAVMTTRKGGVSVHPFDAMNVGIRVHDDGTAVATNRAELARAIGTTPVFLRQVHGTGVVQLTARHAQKTPLNDDFLEGDAAFTTEPGVACVIQVADCLPVLVASADGRVVGAAHGGWRGLAGGVLGNLVSAMQEASGVSAQSLGAWLGPCIGPEAFEVGQDVLDAMVQRSPGHAAHFRESPRADGSLRWRADLPAIARDELRAAGVTRVGGGTWCTHRDPLRFYSFRRDQETGRHAAAIWRRESGPAEGPQRSPG